MTKVAPKFSLVFDSFILLPGQASTSSGRYYNPYDTSNEKSGLALIMFGGRWHQMDGKALQIGLVALFTEGESLLFPKRFSALFQRRIFTC